MGWPSLRNYWFKFQDFRQIVHHFEESIKYALHLRRQYVTGWTWKHLVLDGAHDEVQQCYPMYLARD